MSFLRNAEDLSRPIKGPFSGSRAGSIDSFMRRLRAYRIIEHLCKLVLGELQMWIQHW